MKIKFLYPSDYYDIKTVEPDYEDEFKTASKFPEFDVILYNYDEFISDGELKTYPTVIDDGLCIYRGWMLKPDKYRELYEKLKHTGVSLINDPLGYEKCHLFPNQFYHAIFFGGLQ